MTEDPRVRRGAEAQFTRWRAAIARGDGRIGWKIGINDAAVQRRLGLASAVVGHLTGATALVPGNAHRLTDATRPFVEAEMAIHVGRALPPGADPSAAAAAIAAVGPALELVDIDGPLDDVERIVSCNIFHRAALFGASDAARAGGRIGGVAVSIARNGVEVTRADVTVDLVDTVRLVADFLAAFGERLEAGDRIIAGSVTPPVPITAGDAVTVDFGPLGGLALELV
jgi:2-keto-4-pentenoate hydratase